MTDIHKFLHINFILSQRPLRRLDVLLRLVVGYRQAGIHVLSARGFIWRSDPDGALVVVALPRQVDVVCAVGPGHDLRTCDIVAFF